VAKVGITRSISEYDAITINPEEQFVVSVLNTISIKTFFSFYLSMCKKSLQKHIRMAIKI